MTIVLDTCALIWWSLDPDLLSASAKDVCDLMEVRKNGLVASISLWEIALKESRNNKFLICEPMFLTNINFSSKNIERLFLREP